MLPTDIAPEPMPIEATAIPITGDRVTADILAFNQQNKADALVQTIPLYNDIEVADQEYAASKQRVVASKQAAKRTRRDFNIPEAANQVDIVHANFRENFSRNNDPFQVVPEGGESQERCDVTKQVMMNAMDEGDCSHADDLFIQHYIMYPVAGQKVCIEYIEETELERFSVPTPMADLVYMEAERTGKPVREIGPANMDPLGFSTDTLFEMPTTKGKFRYYYKTIDPRNIAFGDLYTLYKTQDVQTQPHIHEFHYWTREVIENYGQFKNMDKLGEPNANNRHHPHQSGQDTATAPQTTGSANFPLYEIVDSWAQYPFQKRLDAGVYTIEELQAHANEFGYDVNECFIPQKWCATHKEGEALLEFFPNYKKRKREYPYWFKSFYNGGQSYLHRILEACQQIHALRNLHMQNIKTKVKQPIIADKNSDFTQEDVAELHDGDGPFLQKELGSKPIEQQLIFYGQMIDDMTASAMAGIGLLKDDISSFGTPPIIGGKGQADTATQDAINNSRGQQKLNNPFRRMVFGVSVKCWEDLRDLIFLNYTEAQWIQIAGEDGVQMARTEWITPEQISNRFKIVPNSVFDFADRNAKSQQLIAMLNIMIGSGLVGPETAMKMAAGIYQYMGFSRAEINQYTNNQGRGTDPNEEIRVMVMNPHANVEVRPDDPHQICLILAQEAAMQFPQLAQQANFQQYTKMHELYLMMMQAQEAQAAAEKGEEGGPKGPPKQPNPNPPTTQEGTEARQPGQFNSAPDGGMSQMGMTGQGGLAAMGGRYPNSIAGMIN